MQFARYDRDSNMELFRIVSMLLVMVVHACFLSLGVPSHDDAVANPMSVFWRFESHSLSVVCVNVFVLLSGYFGIRFKLRGLLSLLFQAIFFAIVVVLSLLASGYNTSSPFQLLQNIFMLNGPDYWFVKAYIGLYLLAPALNLFIETQSRKTILTFLVVFYIFQTIYGWLSLYGAEWMGGGYSAFSFVGLYMLARYVKINNSLASVRRGYFLLTYFGISVLQALVALLVTYKGIEVAGRLFTYTNPLVIIQSMALLLYFSRLSFKSQTVNWVASSVFAVYLLGCNELVLRPIYGKVIGGFYEKYDLFGFLGCTSLVILAVFVVAIPLDRIRLFTWNRMAKLIS